MAPCFVKLFHFAASKDIQNLNFVLESCRKSSHSVATVTLLTRLTLAAAGGVGNTIAAHPIHSPPVRRIVLSLTLASVPRTSRLRRKVRALLLPRSGKALSPLMLGGGVSN